MTQPVITSRLPDVGTTVFTVMSALATQHNAVNLGQGFPDFGCDVALIDAVTQAMNEGHNQYPPMAGMMILREQIAHKIAALYHHHYHPDTEITVTAGATQAILSAILCLVHPQDEVIVIEPAYDSYLPSIALAGGVAVRVAMTFDEDGFSIDWQKIAASITPKTRLIIINSPNNPTGTVLSRADLDSLAALLREPQNAPILVLSDEVYEHMVFDGAPHVSVSSHAELASRALVISSFGKTFHVTGWKVGYVVAPAWLMAEFKKVHQFNVFTVNTPMQVGLANYLKNPEPYLNLPAFYQAKRDFFRAGLAQSRFTLLPVAGTYFQCVDYSKISDLPELAFAKWLTQEIGVAAIPVSAFYKNSVEQKLVRFCFAKQTATLDKALKKLAAI